MEITTKQKVIISIITIASAFAIGRYSLPAKVITKTETITVEKIVKDDKSDTKIKNNKHYKTVKTETTKPDGTKVVTSVTTIDDGTIKDTKIDDKTNTSTNTDTKNEKTVINNTGFTNISLLAGINPFDHPLTAPNYGISVTRSVLGPFSLTGQVFMDKTLQFGVGLSF